MLEEKATSRSHRMSHRKTFYLESEQRTSTRRGPLPQTMSFYYTHFVVFCEDDMVVISKTFKYSLGAGEHSPM